MAEVSERMRECLAWWGDHQYAAGFRDAELMLCAAMDAGELHALADALNRDAANRARAARVPEPWQPVDWPDAVVRLPGESAEHYAWRRMRGAA